MASNNPDLVCYSLKDGSVVGKKARFTLSIYCLHLSSDEEVLVAGGA